MPINERDYMKEPDPHERTRRRLEEVRQEARRLDEELKRAEEKPKAQEPHPLAVSLVTAVLVFGGLWLLRDMGPALLGALIFFGVIGIVWAVFRH